MGPSQAGGSADERVTGLPCKPWRARADSGWTLLFLVETL